MNRQLLEEPFDPSLIRNRPGPFGQSLSYVGTPHYIRKLNAAFDGQWGCRVIHHEVRAKEVVVLLELRAGEVVKQAFGGSDIATNRSGEAISLADSLKSACADGLKKCCSMLGMGLHLYIEPIEDDRPVSQSSGNGSASRSRGAGNGREQPIQDTRSGVIPPSTRLTQKQLSAIWGLARKLGLTADDVRGRCQALFGSQPEFLDRTNASTLITELIDELGGDPFSGGVQ